MTLQRQNTIVKTNDDQQNTCVECGIDMGLYNPRQLCGKLKCLNK